MAGPPRRDDPDHNAESDFEHYSSEESEGKGKLSARHRPGKKPSGSDAGRADFGGSDDASLDRVVDTLFIQGFQMPRSASTVTSGDPETDRAIDLAVDTLFVEEPETPIPETAAVEAQVVAELDKELEAETDRIAMQELGLAHPPKLPSVPSEEPKPEAVYRRHAATPRSVVAIDSLVKLQEAIMTLEWEISQRSVKALAQELQALRQQAGEDVTVDFAALAMRVVLNYVVKRMSRAHPESIRFLLDVTSFMRSSLASSNHDPLVSFHQILTRYERYKSVVRRAEGIPDATPPILGRLRIKDPDDFSALVEHQTSTLARAGHSLASKIASVDDPENLIRSFRFLATRAFNRILESTVRPKPPVPDKKGGSPRTTSRTGR